MTITRLLLQALAMLSAVTMLLSCGAGGGSGGSSIAGGGIGGTGISRGPITGFGSIFVNDTEFATDNAAILVNGVDAGVGDAAVSANFAVGKVVRVEGIYSGTVGSATRVVFNSNVRGPAGTVTVVDANSRELSVLGQPVIVDDATNIAGGTLADLAAGNLLEVSGLVDERGRIRASFAEKLSDTFMDGGSVEVEGLIAGLDVFASTFMIGMATVDYAGADISQLSTGPVNGQLVRVKGTFSPSSGTLTAMAIAEASELGTDTSQEVEIQGFVTGVITPDEFAMGSQLVRTGPTTRYKGGLAADVKVGARLKVEGSLTGGILDADEISFRDPVDLESRVEAVGPGTLTLTGFTGITVIVNSLTGIDGIVGDLGGISAGDLVKIRGRVSGSASGVLASKIEVENASVPTEVKLQGPVDNIAEPFITVLGLTIDTSGTGIEDDSDAAITAAEFFSVVSAGDTVKARGQLDAGGTLVWEELELEGKL